MDLLSLAITVYLVAAEAKEFTRTDRGGTTDISESQVDKILSDVLALLIIENNENSEKTNPEHKYKDTAISPWLQNLNVENSAIDSSGLSNSDEYPDTDSEVLDSDDSDAYYHEEDHVKNKNIDKLHLSDFVPDSSEVLRKRWRSCQKAGAKVCYEACKISYKHACDIQECSRRLKKVMKRQCSRNCKDLFVGAD